MKSIYELIQEQFIDFAKKSNINKLPKYSLEPPKQKNFGDLATNIAMSFATEFKKSPLQIAEELISFFNFPENVFEKIEIIKPGFINFFISKNYLYEYLQNVVFSENFGKSDYGKEKKVLIEFVSANPVGPLNVVNARSAAIGNAISNLLKESGFYVEKEYYVNNVGTQIENFGLSIEARYLELLNKDFVFPETGYQGEYIKDIAKDIIKQNIEPTKKNFIQFGLESIIKEQKKDLEKYGIIFDNWFYENILHEQNKVNKCLLYLKEKDFTYKKDGAIWFKSTIFQDDKDRVLVRSSEEPTYFLADIAYHFNKYERKFDWIIDLWGPDHGGHILRLKAALVACKANFEKFEILIIQQVSLLSNGQIVKMSKRKGEFISLNDLMEEIPCDVAKFFFLIRSSNSHLDFDLELAKKTSNENPVYYVQYAYVRCYSIFSAALKKNIYLEKNINLDFLKEPEEIELLKKFIYYPEIVLCSAIYLEPHRLVIYLLELVTLFHSYYNKHKIISEDISLTLARLYLIKGISIIIKKSLSILGISIPEKM
ncbi:MAG: arginine--tRNA ligase [bacterium]